MLSAVIGYATHVIAAALLLGIFFVVYTRLTPFDEIALIHAGKASAALSLGGAMIGFSLTLAAAIVYNAGLAGVLGWAVIAMIVQAVVYIVASRVLHTVRVEIEAGNTAMGGFLGAHVGVRSVFLVTSALMLCGAGVTWAARRSAAVPGSHVATGS